MADKKPSECKTVEEVDEVLDGIGAKIEALRKEQRPFLRRKDALVQKQTDEIRAAGAQNLGDDRG